MSLCKTEEFPNIYQNFAMAPTLKYNATVFTYSKTYQNGMHVKMSDHDLHKYTEKHIKLFQ